MINTILNINQIPKQNHSSYSSLSILSLIRNGTLNFNLTFYSLFPTDYPLPPKKPNFLLSFIFFTTFNSLLHTVLLCVYLYNGSCAINSLLTYPRTAINLLLQYCFSPTSILIDVYPVLSFSYNLMICSISKPLMNNKTEVNNVAMLIARLWSVRICGFMVCNLLTSEFNRLIKSIVTVYLVYSSIVSLVEPSVSNESVDLYII